VATQTLLAGIENANIANLTILVTIIFASSVSGSPETSRQAMIPLPQKRSCRLLG